MDSILHVLIDYLDFPTCAVVASTNRGYHKEISERLALPFQTKKEQLLKEAFRPGRAIGVEVGDSQEPLRVFPTHFFVKSEMTKTLGPFSETIQRTLDALQGMPLQVEFMFENNDSVSERIRAANVSYTKFVM